MLAREELKRSLLANLVERVLRKPRRRLGRRAPERSERRDAGDGELVDLGAPDARDAREVVDPVPVRLAERAEVADRAVRDGPRLGVRRVGDELLEPVADAPVVSAELLRPERHALAGPEHDVHELGRVPLDASDLLGVEAELKDVSRLRVPRELRVDDLVPAVGLEFEEVSASSPARRGVKDGLVDHMGGASPNQPLGVGRVARLDDVSAQGAERGEVSRLVLLTLAPDEVGLRVIDQRPRELSTREL